MPLPRSTIVHADITSVGGAAFDVFVSAPHTVSGVSPEETVIQFPLGAKIKMERVIQSCGGGATNTSVGCSRLGMTARFCGVVGDDEWGQTIQENLRREGILTDAAVIVEGEVSSFSIILVDSATGQRTVLYTPNVNAHLSDPIFAREVLQHSSWLFLNHLTDVSCVILDDCLDLVRKPAGLKFAWNPGGSQIREGYQAALISDLLRETDLLFLNAEEALQFTREESIEGAMRQGTRAGVRVMCITDGANGAFLSDGTTTWYCPAPRGAPVVDATGAGDAFAVGVTWAVFRRRDLHTALKAGILNATSVIGMVGAQVGLLTQEQMHERLAKTNLPVTPSPLHTDSHVR